MFFFGKSLAFTTKWEDNLIIAKAPSDYGTGENDRLFTECLLQLATLGCLSKLSPEATKQLVTDLAKKIAINILMREIGPFPKERTVDVRVVTSAGESNPKKFTYIISPDDRIIVRVSKESKKAYNALLNYTQKIKYRIREKLKRIENNIEKQSSRSSKVFPESNKKENEEIKDTKTDFSKVRKLITREKTAKEMFLKRALGVEKRPERKDKKKSKSDIFPRFLQRIKKEYEKDKEEGQSRQLQEIKPVRAENKPTRKEKPFDLEELRRRLRRIPSISSSRKEKPIAESSEQFSSFSQRAPRQSFSSPGFSREEKFLSTEGETTKSTRERTTVVFPRSVSPRKIFPKKSSSGRRKSPEVSSPKPDFVPRPVVPRKGAFYRNKEEKRVSLSSPQYSRKSYPILPRSRVTRKNTYKKEITQKVKQRSLTERHKRRYYSSRNSKERSSLDKSGSILSNKNTLPKNQSVIKTQKESVHFFKSPQLVTVGRYRLFVRKKPTRQAPLSGSKVLAPGVRFRVKGWVKGEKVLGEDRWWISVFGNYVWVGGTIEKPEVFLKENVSRQQKTLTRKTFIRSSRSKKKAKVSRKRTAFSKARRKRRLSKREAKKKKIERSLKDIQEKIKEIQRKLKKVKKQKNKKNSKK